MEQGFGQRHHPSVHPCLLVDPGRLLVGDPIPAQQPELEVGMESAGLHGVPDDVGARDPRRGQVVLVAAVPNDGQNLLAQRTRDPFIGVHEQHPFRGNHVQGGLALARVVVEGTCTDAGPHGPGDRHRAVPAAGVEYQNPRTPRRERTDAGSNLGRLVQCQDDGQPSRGAATVPDGSRGRRRTAGQKIRTAVVSADRGACTVRPDGIPAPRNTRGFRWPRLRSAVRSHNPR